METVNVSELIERDYADYGRYVNTTRAVTGLDGLKKVQRRMLLAVRDVASNELTSSAAVVGRCLCYHPHSESYQTLVKLVNAGFVVGKGSFGGGGLEKIDASPMRYTKVRAHKKFNETVFRLEPHVPHSIDFDLEEPEYLPVPLPLCMTTGTSGIGVGLRNQVPVFDLQSILLARKKDDPFLLKGPKDVLIVSGDLEKLWETGVCWIQYGLWCHKEWSSVEGKDISVIEGSNKVFTPDIVNTFGELVEDGSVYYRDESSSNFKVVVSRVKNVKKFTDDDIHDKCKAVSVKTFYYKMYLSQGGVVRRVSLQNWLDLTWKAFEDSVIKYKKSRLEEIDEKIYIYNLIPKVIPYLQKSTDTDTIAKNLNESKKNIMEVESKSLKFQRRGDLNELIEDLEIEKNRINTITPNSMCDSFVEALNVKE